MPPGHSRSRHHGGWSSRIVSRVLTPVSRDTCVIVRQVEDPQAVHGSNCGPGRVPQSVQHLAVAQAFPFMRSCCVPSAPTLTETVADVVHRCAVGGAPGVRLRAHPLQQPERGVSDGQEVFGSARA
ncbi:hypothetical protein NDU88_004135 [Pleurodeles waltl]|uniref:Uncharacterized protein n=1 Tax=Pleurodeles waltl TaxID=8319 RepID=A0AAV7W7D9_PLEWA|nr:hypothetical protein NDU88_004135 [Pleurodeles waltl]